MMKKRSNETLRFIKQFVVLSIVFGTVIGYVGYGIARIQRITEPVIATKEETEQRVIVIDPGHGGEDGGAVASDGTTEKELNLEYGKTLLAFCRLFGIDAVITRKEDELLYDRYRDFDDYTGKKKVYDLKNRLRFVNEIGSGAVFVGIHMNKFGDPKYSGTQVYFSPGSTDSMKLAELIRDSIRSSLQKDNEREIKKAGSAIFLLHRMKVPSVLVECGFLSNETETIKLKDSTYKKEFSLTLAVSIGEFLNSLE